MSHTRKPTATSLRGEQVKNINWSTGTAIATFLVGVILFLSFGKDWLNFDSPLVFLVGLIGVAIPVLLFAAWKLYQRSDKNDK